MLKELILAIRAYFSAHRFILQHQLWKWMIVPGILYAYLFVVGMNYFSQSSSFFIESIILRTGLKSWVDTLSNDLLGFFITMGSFWLWFTLLLFYFALFKYLFLMLFAPFFAYLHLRIDAIQKNIPYVFNSNVYRKLITRALLLNVTNLLWQTVYLIPIVIICTLPIIGWFTPIFTILIECYFLGAAMLDYSLASEHKNKVAAAAYVNNHKGLPIGNGLIFYLLHFIPILGWITAPFYSLIAAQLNTLEVKDNA
ncbi:MAG: EI24 domain-containing protein [Chitinophagia bacterium]